MNDEPKRCSECNALMFKFMYKHNSEHKVEYRCPHPHNFSNGKTQRVVDFVDMSELDDQ